MGQLPANQKLQVLYLSPHKKEEKEKRQKQNHSENKILLYILLNNQKVQVIDNNATPNTKTDTEQHGLSFISTGLL